MPRASIPVKVKKLFLSILAGAFLTSVLYTRYYEHGVTTAFAQSGTTELSSPALGSPALGLDMWNTLYAQEGLFTPHSSSACNPRTETFVTINGRVGYCIDKAVRVGGQSVSWMVARNVCTNARKRLPEPAEWEYACNIGAILTTGQKEWDSNFAVLVSPYATTTGVGASAGGYLLGTACNGSFGFVNTSPSNFAAFRCVH
jgi:hypothetical protein